MYCRVPHFIVEVCLSLAPTRIIAEDPVFPVAFRTVKV